MRCFPLLLLLACAPASAGAEPPRTVDELVERAARSLVAVRVERTSDLPASGFQPRRISPEGRSLYERPPGPVSGLLIDAEGHVVTSHYNVAGTLKSIEVITAGGETFPARLLGKSEQDDIALLRIDRGEKALPFAPLEWASTEALRVGSFVFALGRSPDPAKVTATRGIVSAARRNGGRAIQTDAELNYGNAGGPVIDLEGRLVAIACFVGHTNPQWGLNSGVGFGTSAATLQAMLPQLKRGEDVRAFEPGFLGIQGGREILASGGARVDALVPGGAASAAGIVEGDVIAAIDGVTLHDFDHLRRIVFQRRPQEKLKLKVRRGEDTLELDLVLGEAPR
jgi:S1-C subfamily serine protease